MEGILSFILGIILALGGGASSVYDQTLGSLSVLKPSQGGTGIGSATAGQVGTCIKVLDDSPFTYELGTCGGGSGTSAFEIATTSDIAVPQVAYFTKTAGRTTLGSVATGTVSSANSALSVTSNRSVLGGNLTLTVASTSNNLFTGTAGQVLAFLDGGWVGVATSTLSTITGLLTVDKGGTGATSFTSGQLLYGAGTSAVQTVATTSVSCSGNTSCTSFVAIGGSPITISSTAGGGSGTVSTSTNETAGRLAYWTTTSGTPALLGEVATGTISVPTGLTGTANRYVVGGNFTLGLDTGYVIPLQSTLDGKVNNTRNLTVAGTAKQITSSAGAQDLSADRTWTLSLPSFVQFPGDFNATNATTTSATTTANFTSQGNTWLSSMTSALLLTDANGLVGEYAGTSCTNQFVRSLSALGVATCATVQNTDLANSSVSYGGVSVSLGGSDATPAFNLADATSLPISTGVSGLGTGVATFLGTPSIANFFSALTGEGAGVETFLTTPSSANFLSMLTDALDLGGETSFEIPNGTAPTVDAVGELAFDTTDNQLLIASSTNATYPLVFPTRTKLWGATIASTSVDFVSGGRIWLPPQRDGFVVKEFHCAVDGGTSVVFALSNSGGTTDSETITCDADGAQDTDVATNNSYSAGSLNSIEIGTVTGSVDYLTFSIYGVYTRE